MASINLEMKSSLSICLISLTVAFIIIHSAILKLRSETNRESMEKRQSSADKRRTLLPDQTPFQKGPTQKKRGISLYGKENPQKIFSKVSAIKKAKESALRQGYQYHELGDFDRAASKWAKAITSSLHRNDFTIQLLLACQKRTLLRSFQHTTSPEKLYYLKWPYDGRYCYKLCMGLYESRREAELERSEIPNYFRSHGNKPIIIPVSSLQKGLSEP